jgi:hypothetical protein
VFIDVDTLRPGDDFVETIEARLRRCDALLAVIGPRWLTVVDEHGKRRLDDPADYLRLELEAALEGQVRVIPVLVGGASMPAAEQLPDPTGPLARRHAIELRDTRWADDLAKLMVQLRALDPDAPAPLHGTRSTPVRRRARGQRAILWSSIALLVVSAATGIAVWRQQVGDSPPTPTRSAVRRPDVVLPAPAGPPSATSPDVPRGGASSTADSRATAPPPKRTERAPSPSTPQQSIPRAPASPVESPHREAAPPLDGVWSLSEEIAEDVHAIECTASGALQLRFDDGLIDGSVRLKRDCRDSRRSTTDSTESTAALSAGTNAGDAVAFVTRVVDEGLVTTCRYSGQIVGSAKATMAGEVTCEARAEGLSSVLRLRGSWRANRTSP